MGPVINLSVFWGKKHRTKPCEGSINDRSGEGRNKRKIIEKIIDIVKAEGAGTQVVAVRGFGRYFEELAGFELRWM